MEIKTKGFLAVGEVHLYYASIDGNEVVICDENGDGQIDRGKDSVHLDDSEATDVTDERYFEVARHIVKRFRDKLPKEIEMAAEKLKNTVPHSATCEESVSVTLKEVNSAKVFFDQNGTFMATFYTSDNVGVIMRSSVEEFLSYNCFRFDPARLGVANFLRLFDFLQLNAA